VLQAELLRTTGTGPTRSSPALPDRVRRDVALVAVFVAALVGCTPSTAPVPPAAVASVSCGALSKRDCEGYVEAARVALNINESARVVADAGCPAANCDPPVRAWVVFIGVGDRVIGTVVLRGDPSGPPTAERWTGPLPSLPPR